MLISVLIMSVFVIGAGVLLYTTPVPEVETPEPPPVNQRPGLPSEISNVELPGTNPITPEPPPPPVEEEPEPEPPPQVRSVIITYNGRENRDFTARVGERVDLRVRVIPEGIEEVVEWTSSNENVFQVVALDTEGSSARVTGVGNGNATVTASVGGVSAETIVRIR